MKKIIVLSFVVAAFCLSSCKKDRTCTCTTTSIGGGTTEVSTSVKTVGHDTESEAKKETGCYASKSTVTENGSASEVTQDCKLN